MSFCQSPGAIWEFSLYINNKTLNRCFPISYIPLSPYLTLFVSAELRASTEMATRFFTRSSLLTPTKQTLTSFFSRSFASLSLSKPSQSLSTTASSFSLLRLRPLVAVASSLRSSTSVATGLRGFATRHTSSSLNDPNPNWSNRPPKETILLDGCDFEHWLVVMEKPEGDPTRDEIIDSYIKTLAEVVGRFVTRIFWIELLVC